MQNQTSFQQAFIQTINNYSPDTGLAPVLWQEIKKAYSGKKRYYHNLQHLDHLLAQLLQVRDLITDWNVIILAIAYHDIIYNTSRHDNEEKSAALAGKRLSFIRNLPIERCEAHIIATKTHVLAADSDTNYFTDADLSVLGACRLNYEKYARDIRKEYAVYPDLLFKAGRKKVIRYFISLERIFKTNWFYKNFEVPARENLEYELNCIL